MQIKKAGRLKVRVIVTLKWLVQQDGVESLHSDRQSLEQNLPFLIIGRQKWFSGLNRFRIAQPIHWLGPEFSKQSAGTCIRPWQRGVLDKRPEGSFVTGILTEANAREMILRAWCCGAKDDKCFIIDGQAYAWPFSVFTPKQMFGPRIQPIWIKFCTHLLLYGVLWADLDRDRRVGVSMPN